MDKKILEEIYKINPFSVENKTIFPNYLGEKAYTYGELTVNGTNTFIESFHQYINQDTVFYDLGSGVGKMVIHIGLQCPVKKSIGVEFSKERHEMAIQLKETYTSHKNNIELYCDSFLSYDISDATLIYVDDTCMEGEIFEKVYGKVPSGCVFTFKKSERHPCIKEKVQKSKRGIERTYYQTDLYWIIKE